MDWYVCLCMYVCMYVWLQALHCSYTYELSVVWNFRAQKTKTKWKKNCGHTKETRRQSMVAIQSNCATNATYRSQFCMYGKHLWCEIYSILLLFAEFPFSSIFQPSFDFLSYTCPLTRVLSHSLAQSRSFTRFFSFVWLFWIGLVGYRFVFQHTEVWRPNDFKLQQ